MVSRAAKADLRQPLSGDSGVSFLVGFDCLKNQSCIGAERVERLETNDLGRCRCLLPLPLPLAAGAWLPLASATS